MSQAGLADPSHVCVSPRELRHADSGEEGLSVPAVPGQAGCMQRAPPCVGALAQAVALSRPVQRDGGVGEGLPCGDQEEGGAEVAPPHQGAVEEEQQRGGGWSMEWEWGWEWDWEAELFRYFLYSSQE